MSRRLRAGLALAAGCLLTPSHAVEGPIPNGPLEYGPVPVSKLVSRRELQFKVAKVQRAGVQTTVLAYQTPGGTPSPVAVVSYSRSGDEAHVSIHRHPLSKSAVDRGDLIVATFEHLYALTLRQDPEASFCLADGGPPCDAGSKGQSHAEVLRELARARQHAVDRSKGARTSVPWHVVSLAPPNVDRAEPDEVSVRISSDQGTMEGVTVFFNRAPHSSCVARSRGDGLATCHLVDQHGDDDSHSEDEKAPVLAIYPGDVRAERVLLPTTLIMSPRP